MTRVNLEHVVKGNGAVRQDDSFYEEWEISITMPKSNVFCTLLGIAADDAGQAACVHR